MLVLDKKVVGKSKAEQMNERQQELERRLQDVTGQLGSGKKSTKKGKDFEFSTLSVTKNVSLLQTILAKPMHKHPTANRRRAVLVIHPHRARQTAVPTAAPTAKQVRRIMSNTKQTSFSIEILKVFK